MLKLKNILNFIFNMTDASVDEKTDAGAKPQPVNHLHKTVTLLNKNSLPEHKITNRNYG